MIKIESALVNPKITYKANRILWNNILGTNIMDIDNNNNSPIITNTFTDMYNNI